VSASGINPAWQADYFIRAGWCPCDPCAGQECRLCNGEAADESELRGYKPRPRERSAAA
jgi:hypothetical protein